MTQPERDRPRITPRQALASRILYRLDIAGFLKPLGETVDDAHVKIGKARKIIEILLEEHERKQARP